MKSDGYTLRCCMTTINGDLNLINVGYWHTNKFEVALTFRHVYNKFNTLMKTLCWFTNLIYHMAIHFTATPHHLDIVLHNSVLIWWSSINKSGFGEGWYSISSRQGIRISILKWRQFCFWPCTLLASTVRTQIHNFSLKYYALSFLYLNSQSPANDASPSAGFGHHEWKIWTYPGW